MYLSHTPGLHAQHTRALPRPASPDAAEWVDGAATPRAATNCAVLAAGGRACSFVANPSAAAFSLEGVRHNRVQMRARWRRREHGRCTSPCACRARRRRLGGDFAACKKTLRRILETSPACLLNRKAGFRSRHPSIAFCDQASHHHCLQRPQESHCNCAGRGGMAYLARQRRHATCCRSALHAATGRASRRMKSQMHRRRPAHVVGDQGHTAKVWHARHQKRL